MYACRGDVLAGVQRDHARCPRGLCSPHGLASRLPNSFHFPHLSTLPSPTPSTQLVEAVLHEAELGRVAVADATRERLEFECAWGAWVGSQLQAGMSQPLPRGWMPQPDAASWGLHFLNTRTGRGTRGGGEFHTSTQAQVGRQGGKLGGWKEDGCGVERKGTEQGRWALGPGGGTRIVMARRLLCLLVL